MTNQRVLVTGAGGFIGRSLVAELLRQQELEVHTVSRGPLELETQHHRCDLMDGTAVEALLRTVRPELLIHMAWYTEHGKFWQAQENLTWVAATVSLIRAFRQAGGRRFVGLGTCAEYAWDGDDDLMEQSSAMEPSTLYGASKDATRRVLQSFAESFALDWAWARLFMPYGAGEAPTRLLTSIALPLLRGSVARCSPGDQLRDFLHVEDVARGIACVALSTVVGPVNVASGEAKSVRWFAAEVARAAGRPAGLKVGALPMLAGDPKRIVADTTLLKSLGFRPKFDLCAGIARAIEDLQASLAGA